MTSDKPVRPIIPIPELESLFDTSIRVFLRKGIISATLDDVAEAVGVPHKTLMATFATKEDLAVSALRWYYLKYSQQMQSVMAMHSDAYSALEGALFEFVELCCDDLKADKGLFWPTLVDLGYVDDELWKAFKDLQFDWEDQIRDKLTQCRNELINPGDIEVLTSYFIMVFEGLYEMVKFGTPREKLFQLIKVSMEVLGSRMKTGGK